MISYAPFPDQQTALSEILEELHDEVYVYDANTLSVIYANKTARRRCDWSEAEVRSKKIYDSSKMFDTEAFHSHVEPLRARMSDAVTVETLHEKGLVEITTRYLSSLHGSPVFLSVLRDREHRRQLERARAQAFSEIVHDLRTPLTSIMGALKLMDSGTVGEMPPQAKSMLELIQRNADNLLSIVGDILDLQKYSTSATPEQEEFEQLDLVELVKEAVAAHLGYCAVHNVQLSLRASPDQAWIKGVPLRLHQLLANLLSNAIKNSPSHETVDIEMLGTPDSWQIRIANTGPGIPEHLRDRIFENYVQHASAKGTKVKGTGLGLAICKKIIKTHGGEIGFSCDTGEKTVFYVSLPKQAPPHEKT
ncbi:MAG: hypothetical protein CML60_10425 [Rhodobacteraceae bacterium]|nr:hypothetical protein [Paracoccaceae bacterium]MBT26793.1 hypothetical protein [Paracoccaceae bacterium]